MSTEKSYGRFVWFDLMSTDIAAAQPFYTALCGWHIKDVDMGPMGTYPLIMVGDKDIGGFMKAPPNVPSHWLGYVSVDKVDDAAARATRLGGKLMMPPMDIPNIGRFAVVSDPQGGVSAPFQYAMADKPEADGAPPLGTFCWSELMTSDVEGAKAFYGELYGWSVEAMEMGPGMTYHLFKSGGRQRAGLMNKPAEMPGPAAWMHYVHIQDVDQGFAQVPGLGGTCLVPPMDIPKIGRFAVVQDPAGGVVALFQEPRKGA